MSDAFFFLRLDNEIEYWLNLIENGEIEEVFYIPVGFHYYNVIDLGDLNE